MPKNYAENIYTIHAEPERETPFQPNSPVYPPRRNVSIPIRPAIEIAPRGWLKPRNSRLDLLQSRIIDAECNAIEHDYRFRCKLALGVGFIKGSRDAVEMAERMVTECEPGSVAGMVAAEMTGEFAARCLDDARRSMDMFDADVMNRRSSW